MHKFVLYILCTSNLSIYKTNCVIEAVFIRNFRGQYKVIKM